MCDQVGGQVGVAECGKLLAVTTVKNLLTAEMLKIIKIEEQLAPHGLPNSQ